MTNRLLAVFTALLLLGALLPSASSVVIVTGPRPPLIIVGNIPSNFVVGPYEEYTVYFYVADDFGLGDVRAYYRVNGGEWRPAYAKTAAAGENWSIYQSIINRFYGETQNFYVFYRKFNIPGAAPGTRIDFKIEATDVEGHTSVSPVYTYYVTNPAGPKVLIVDPSVEAMAFERSLDSLMLQFNLSREFYYYNLSDFEAIAEPLTKLKAWMFTEHRWEALAGEYNIKIVSPDELTEALNEFKPEVVILSNLWLPEWGLSVEQMAELENYLEVNHAGLIVTAGTLFDATNPQHVGDIDGSPSIARMVGLELLPVAESARSALNLTSVPVIISHINTGYSLILSEKEPFAGGRVDANVYSTAGWQYILPSVQFGIAKRSVIRFASENGLRMREMGDVVKSFTGLQFNFSMAASLSLAEAIGQMRVSDDGVSLRFGNSSAELTPDRRVLERIRLLHSIREYVPMLLARTEDYSGGILAREGDYRAVYISLELEAGGEEELAILKNLIDWTLDYEPPQMPEVVILSNDIDWGIRGTLLASQLEALGFSVRRVTADEFETYKRGRIIVILGGPEAYDGVGSYVQQALSLEEQNAIINGEAGMFIKTDVWAEGQVVIVLAGQDRWGTSRKIKAYLEGLDLAYAELLAEFSAAVS
ncbi:hypothetical protein [Thermococcus sp. LS1]|uniref:hypothetical protein n=1 Tax=Thermococcus sp. LS1 TaxID=1638259 RepID=UPI001980D5D2|nr:hypothetical protein [Thermococcus sp. LS1]